MNVCPICDLCYLGDLIGHLVRGHCDTSDFAFSGIVCPCGYHSTWSGPIRFHISEHGGYLHILEHLLMGPKR